MTEAVASPSSAQPLAGGGRADMSGDNQFAELLRLYRERAGLTQRSLADLSTISPRTIRELEAGRANARTRTIDLLADALRLQGLMRELFIRAGLGGRRNHTLHGELTLAAPKPLNALVGRDTEVRALVEVLESGRQRMISISGFPGVGKTRVAAEIAARLSARRGWPVLWLGTDPPPRSEHGTGFGPLLRSLRSLFESRIEDVSQVCNLVGRHETLLVIDGLADVMMPTGVTELLAYCPGVRVISTSRAPWHIPGAQTAVISPLATPGPEWDAGSSLDALAGVPAVGLLVDRLAGVRPGFALGPATAGAAVEICRRVDGLPLALEVVAGRFRVLSLQQLTEVPAGDVLDLTLPAGSATIGGLIGASVERLADGQLAILRVLVGADRTWTVPEVAAALHRPLDEVVDELGVLIGSGLVRASHGEPLMALCLPNLLRAFLTRRRWSSCQTPHSWGCVSHPPTRTLELSPIHLTDEGEGMASDSPDALREAGILGATMQPELEEFYASLTKDEAEVLISLKSRLDRVLPDVMAHSQEWTRPKATEEGFEAAMLCACGLWTGCGKV